MSTAPERPNSEIGETERVIEEFRLKIVQSLEKERSKLRELAEQDSKLILAKAYQESSNITARAREESTQILEKAKEQAGHEVDNILSQAQQRAEIIINNAEENIRKEAKERTRKEVENLIRNAKEEASKLVARTLQTAREEAGQIITNSKNEAAILAKQLTDDAESEIATKILEAEQLKKQAQEELASAQKKADVQIEQILIIARADAKDKAEKEASAVITQAKTKAQNERESLLASTLVEAKKAADAETAKIILKAKEEAAQIVNEAKKKVSIQIEESSRLMIEIQQKMQQVIGAAGLDLKKNEPKVETTVAPDISPKKPDPMPVPTHELPLQEIIYPEPSPIKEPENSHSETPQAKINSIFGEEGNRTYQGRLKIDIAPPVDGEQISILEQSLTKTANLRLIGKGGAEDGSAWVEIEAIKPVPLLDILRKIPSVKDVVGAKSYIIVALKATQLV